MGYQYASRLILHHQICHQIAFTANDTIVKPGRKLQRMQSFLNQSRFGGKANTQNGVHA